MLILYYNGITYAFFMPHILYLLKQIAAKKFGSQPNHIKVLHQLFERLTPTGIPGPPPLPEGRQSLGQPVYIFPVPTLRIINTTGPFVAHLRYLSSSCESFQCSNNSLLNHKYTIYKFFIYLQRILISFAQSRFTI